MMFSLFGLIAAGILMGISLRNEWVYKTRMRWIANGTYTVLSRRFSYHAMVLKYFWVWNPEWFERRAGVSETPTP